MKMLRLTSGLIPMLVLLAGCTSPDAASESRGEEAANVAAASQSTPLSRAETLYA